MMKTNQNYDSPKMEIIFFEKDAWVFTVSGTGTSDTPIQPSTASYEEYNDR